MRFCLLVSCLLIGVCGESLSSSPASAPSTITPVVTPRTLASDPHAVRRNRVKDRPSSPEEFIPTYDRFLSRNTRLNDELEHMFQAWDSNRDGVLSQNEINLLCERSVITPTEYDVLMSWDVNDSGDVDHTEFKLGPLFVNALEADKARNEAFNHAAAAHPHPDPAAATQDHHLHQDEARFQQMPIEPLGDHVLEARQYFRTKLGLDAHPLTATSLPLSSKLAESQLAASVASDIAPSPAAFIQTHMSDDTNDNDQDTTETAPAEPEEARTPTPASTPAVLLSLSEKITHKAQSQAQTQASKVDLHGLDDTLRLPDLLTTPNHNLESLLQRVDSTVKQTLNTQCDDGEAVAGDDLSTVSFEKPTLDNLDEWVGKAKDIMEKLKQKKLGQAIEEAVPQTKFIEEKWRLTSKQHAAAAARSHQPQSHHHHQQHPQQRVYAYRQGRRAAAYPYAPMPGMEMLAEMGSSSSSPRDGSRFGRWNRKSRGDTGRVVGKEFYVPSSHQPAQSVAELRARRIASENTMAQTNQLLQQAAAPPAMSMGMGMGGGMESAALLQRDQSESQMQTQTQARSAEQIMQEGEALVAQERLAEQGPDELRLQQERQKQINLGGALGASVGASLGGSVKIGGSASIGGSLSVGAGIKASAGASIGASASVGTKAATPAPAPAATKPQVKITLKPAAPTGDGLPLSKFGIPSYDDERCVLCQFLVQRTETNLFKRMLIVLDMDRRAGVEAGVGRNAVTLPQPYTAAGPGSTGANGEPGTTADSFTTTTAPGGGATGVTGYIWDVLSRAYSGGGSNLDYGLWMDPSDPNNVDSTSEPLSDYVMKDVIRHVADYTDGRGHGIVRYTAEDTLSDFCAEDNVPELFYAYCPDFWSALPTIVDALYFGFHGDATCEEAQMCGATTYFAAQNSVHLPNKSRYYNAGRGVCGLVGGSRERQRGGKLLSATCTVSKVLGKF